MDTRDLHCPECGESTITVEQPTDNEIWIKCTACNLFIGLSEEDWKHMRNSPLLEEMIGELYDRDYRKRGEGQSCRVCTRYYEEGGITGICNQCLYKAMVIIVVIMFITSFTIWFGFF